MPHDQISKVLRLAVGRETSDARVFERCEMNFSKIIATLIAAGLAGLILYMLGHVSGEVKGKREGYDQAMNTVFHDDLFGDVKVQEIAKAKEDLK